MNRPSASSEAPEQELLLLCARMAIDTSDEARITGLVREGLDWNLLIGTAHQHRVLPLLWRTLSRVAPDSVPESAKSRLRQAFHANAKRNLLLTGELLQVIDIFRAHDIPSISYKGPVLASLVYGDIALRQFADLDVIIPATEVAKARALLGHRGYRPEKPMSDDALVGLLRFEKHITLLRDDRGINLEVHWAITTPTDPIRIRPERLWRDLRGYSIAGRTVQTHTDEDLLLIQCVHGAKHGWERLGWLCDVAEIVRSRRDLNWKRSMGCAADLGAARILLLGVSLARDLLGAEPPASVVQAIKQDSVLQRLSRQLGERLLSENPVGLDLGEREQYFMDLREHPADKFRVALQQAKTYLTLTARDTESLPVPGFLTGVLYLLRPIRLAWEYGLAPFKRFFRGVFQP